MKRSIYGLLVAMTAYGLCAFTNIREMNAYSTYFYQVSEGNYSSTPPMPAKTCVLNSSYPCTLQFRRETGLENFNASQIPALSSQYGSPIENHPSKRYN